MSAKTLFAGIAAAALAAGAVSVAVAAIPDGSGVIHGCYRTFPPVGQLRVVDTDRGQRCAASEKPLDWNARGVAGPTGPTGSTGPSGTSVGWFTKGSGTAFPTDQTFASLSLPAGTFMVTLTGEGVDPDGADGYVRLGCSIPGTAVAAPLFLKGQGGSLAGSGVVTLPAPAALHVDCHSDPFDPADPPLVFVQLSAIQVDEAHVQ